MQYKQRDTTSYSKLFSEMKREFLKLDPVSFVENYLKIDGSEPYKISGNGWKFMADIFRYIAINATQANGKPVVILKGRQVGATTMAGALDLYFTASGLFGKTSAPMRVLHCFPQLAHVKRFVQDKLETMIRTSTGDYINKQKLGYNAKTKRVSDSKIPDNMTLKQFVGGCSLWAESLGDDADRIRGMSVDALFTDEVQDISKQAIGNATKILTAAKYGPKGVGVQIYFGTPKEKGSYFEKGLWDQTDKRYYHLGCTNQDCGMFFLLYTPGSEEWENIWIEHFIVKCPYCNLEQDKRTAVENGKWIASEPFDADGKEKQYVGFHINQLYLPYFAKENIMRLQPKNNPSQSERVYFNEVLGEFYSGAGMPITKEEIYEKCRDPDRSFSRSIDPTQKRSWMGLDWGGKVDGDNKGGGMSYSCAVILSVGADDVLDVEFAYKLTSTDFQYKMAFVQEMFRKYGLRSAVADFFYGQDIVGELQKLYGKRFLGCHAQGTMKSDISYDKDMLLLKWNKDYYIEELYNLMRKGKIRFPWKSYESIAFLIDHITSMEMENRITNGIMRKSFKKGPEPNDAFMALIHAYLAYKFETTNHFTINPNNPSHTQNTLPVLAYSPKMR